MPVPQAQQVNDVIIFYHMLMLTSRSNRWNHFITMLPLQNNVFSKNKNLCITHLLVSLVVVAELV
jgi:hypothetical protein